MVLVETQDTSPPVISSCPSDQTQLIQLGAASPVISWVEPTATDLSGNSTIMHQSHQIGTTFPKGTTNVTYVLSDPSGNIATCSFNVGVTIGKVSSCFKFQCTLFHKP
ncbi:Hyalin [Holothuria leucospilota]|uniref:Hyalin n=1 Tax=Holothuria leucospilota TaxID=206669 RepID=A0A9Q1C457_HOLLE|nr:Hyalin [Holothuria leucospilota]